MPAQEQLRADDKLRGRSYDWIALGLLISSVAFLTSGLTIAPEVGWATPYLWLMLVIGILSLVCLIV